MRNAVPLDCVYYSTEPEIPVIGGPLMRGYALCLKGKIDAGEAVVGRFLASVYYRRPLELSTEKFVREIEDERGIEHPADRSRRRSRIVREAVRRRFEKLHLPLLRSIQEQGYRATRGGPITMKRESEKLLVCDGKNRCSILAAMGQEIAPNVVIV